MLENLIFVSYRRADTAPLALALKLEIEGHLRAAQVFVDTQQIRGADRWATEIEMALQAAKVVLVFIGPNWAGESEGKHRMDDAEDWVRREVETALRDKPTAVVPVLVNRTPMPDVSTLPPGCADIATIQAVQLDVDSWRASVAVLLDLLTGRFGYQRKTNQKFPTPDPLIKRTIPVPWPELDVEVMPFLAKWSIEFSDGPERLPHKRIELVRTFEFASFTDAMAFMQKVGAHAQQVDHHPRLVSVWRSVTVGLTTWDAGHRVTSLDIEFARVLDRLVP